MILNFNVRIEVTDFYGEKLVPYLKEILAGSGVRVGVVRSVVYEGNISRFENRVAEALEMDAYEKGELDL